MALKSKCEKCGGEIVVKYLKPGEEALCRNCGVYVAVPETGVGADEGPELAKMGPKLEGPFEDYHCPACGGTNLNKKLWDFYLGWSVPWFYYVIACRDCGARFKAKHPKALLFRALFVLIIIALCLLTVCVEHGGC